MLSKILSLPRGSCSRQLVGWTLRWKSSDGEAAWTCSFSADQTETDEDGSGHQPSVLHFGKSRGVDLDRPWARTRMRRLMKSPLTSIPIIREAEILTISNSWILASGREFGATATPGLYKDLYGSGTFTFTVTAQAVPAILTMTADDTITPVSQTR